MKKRFLFKKLAIFTGLIISLSCNTFASTTNQEIEVINPTPEEIELSKMHEQAKQSIAKGRLASESINEFDLLCELSELSEEELTEQGYNSEQIKAIKSDDLENTMRETIFDRAELPKDTFKLNGGPYGQYYVALEGYGTMVLSQTGLANNAKITIKYAHTTVSLSTPSVAYPWGVGFGFNKADTVFQPNKVLTSQTATRQ